MREIKLRKVDNEIRWNHFWIILSFIGFLLNSFQFSIEDVNTIWWWFNGIASSIAVFSMILFYDRYRKLKLKRKRIINRV